MIELQEILEMFEKNPLAQVVVDPDLRIVLMNDAFCKLVGFEKDRLMGMPFTEFRTKGMIKYLKDSGESVADAARMRKKTMGESTFDTPSGLHIVIRTNIPINDAKGDLRYVYVTYNEITKVVKSQQYMEAEVAELSKTYGKMAEGDLTVRYEIKKPDEDTKETYEQLIKLRNAVRGIVTNLEQSIGDVNKKMENLTSSAENATNSLQDASKGVQQIAMSSGKVSENAEKASQNVDQITKAMQDMSAAVEEITSSMESVSHLSKETDELSRSGATLAGNAEKSMQEISISSKNVFEIVSGV